MYHLVVEVDDGKQSATTKVTVKIINVNDNKPIFQNQNPMQIAGILEEEVPREPIMTVRLRSLYLRSCSLKRSVRRQRHLWCFSTTMCAASATCWVGRLLRTERPT